MQSSVPCPLCTRCWGERLQTQKSMVTPRGETCRFLCCKHQGPKRVLCTNDQKSQNGFSRQSGMGVDFKDGSAPWPKHFIKQLCRASQNAKISQFRVQLCAERDQLVDGLVSSISFPFQDLMHPKVFHLKFIANVQNAKSFVSFSKSISSSNIVPSDRSFVVHMLKVRRH